MTAVGSSPLVAPEAITLQTPVARLAACAWGPPDGEPFLALHGWLDNANSFAKLVPLLDPSWRIVAVDLPGHGLSEPRPPGAAYHFVDWLPDVYEIADALGWETFNLVGHSMGAGIASMAAGVFPERLRRVILLEGLGPLTAEDHEGPGMVAQYIVERRRLARREPLPHETREAAAERLAKVVPNLSMDSAMLLVERGTKEVSGGVTWRADPRLRRTSPHRFTEGQVHAFFAQVTAPTLILWAEDGWPFDEAILHQRVAAFPNAVVHELPGGHHFHMEAAPAVAAAIREFVG